jgi:hypothetical protein
VLVCHDVYSASPVGGLDAVVTTTFQQPASPLYSSILSLLRAGNHSLTRVSRSRPTSATTKC